MNETGNVGHIGAETVPSIVALLHRRPQVALRRISDPYTRLAVQSFILNRRTKAKDVSLKVALERLSVPTEEQSEQPTITGAPGIAWRKNKSGWEARWRARADVIRRGFNPKIVRLWAGRILSTAEKEKIANTCRRLQKEMLAWHSHYRNSRPTNISYQGPGHVYFLDDGERIKIGYSKNYYSRIGHIIASHSRPITVLGAIPGSRRDERIIHDQFKHLRANGEWFNRDHDLQTFISAATTIGV